MGEDGVINEELRKMLLEDLLTKRVTLEKDIKELCNKRVAAYSEVNSENKKNVSTQEIDRMEALYNEIFAKLNKVNVRIDRVKSPNFSVKCPICGGDMTEDLKVNP